MDEDIMGMTIMLKPTHAGYQVIIDGEWIGSILLRIYEGDRRVEDGTALAVSAQIDIASQRFGTVGAALDYLTATNGGYP